MGGDGRGRLPGCGLVIVGVLAVSSIVSLGALRAQAGPALSIAVSGNHFVNGSGATVRLLGVDAPSTEYACDQGWGYASQPLTLATAACHRGVARQCGPCPAQRGLLAGSERPAVVRHRQVGYQQAIETWVADLNAAGLYAILDLHWTAPGTDDADGQRPMPDDHSAAFWSSVASAFENNHAVVFDAFNEPYSPAGERELEPGRELVVLARRRMSRFRWPTRTTPSTTPTPTPPWACRPWSTPSEPPERPNRSCSEV